jgi:hypothetical protein
VLIVEDGIPGLGTECPHAHPRPPAQKAVTAWVELGGHQESHSKGKLLNNNTHIHASREQPDTKEDQGLDVSPWLSYNFSDLYAQ